MRKDRHCRPVLRIALIMKGGTMMNQSLTHESSPPRISLDDCLRRNVKWSRTRHPTALWRAEVGADTWTVRVNDFPEERLYTLFWTVRVNDFPEERLYTL